MMGNGDDDGAEESEPEQEGGSGDEDNLENDYRCSYSGPRLSIFNNTLYPFESILNTYL
jgi:hypothetical protein